MKFTLFLLFACWSTTAFSQTNMLGNAITKANTENKIAMAADSILRQKNVLGKSYSPRGSCPHEPL